MCAIAANMLQTSLRRYGTTRQLSGAVISCVVLAMLLLPAFVWYHVRFHAEQAALSLAEVQFALVYVVLCGWVLPSSVTVAFYLFTEPRYSTTSMRLPSQGHTKHGKHTHTTRIDEKSAFSPPRAREGVIPPFVYNDETPWGWLEYRSGRWQGQRLALKRTIITIGRDEEVNDIWIDDDLASRQHAEIAWFENQVFLSDRDSLNGVVVNGARIRGFTLLQQGDIVEIGYQHFIFHLAEHTISSFDMSDPLAHHKWHSSLESLTGRADAVGNNTPPAPTRPLSDRKISNPVTPLAPLLTSGQPIVNPFWQETAQIEQITPIPVTPVGASGAVKFHDGPLAQKIFPLDRPVISVGRGIECDITVDDVSISRWHTQFLRQPTGDFVQDLSSRNGTKVNDEVLTKPHPLVEGDIISIGNIHLEYTSVQAAHTAALSDIITPATFSSSANPSSLSGPLPLKLPSRQKS